MEYFIYPSMFRQFNIYDIVEEPGMYPPGTLEFFTLELISKPLISMRLTLAKKKFFQKF